MSGNLDIIYCVYEQFSPILTADVSNGCGTICLISVTDPDDSEKGLTIRFPHGRPTGMSECDFDKFMQAISVAADRVREYAGWKN